MRKFLFSEEPILLAEVGQWLAKQPQAVRDELTEANTNYPGAAGLDISADWPERLNQSD